MKNSFSINHFPEFHHIKTLKFTNISSSLDYAEISFHFFFMQYSLLHSSSIAQYFSFYKIKLFQLVNNLYFFEAFISKKTKKIAVIARSYKQRTCDVDVTDLRPRHHKTYLLCAVC